MLLVQLVILPGTTALLAFRKIPSFNYKARQGYVLQRAVPAEVQSVIGKAKFKEPGGSTLGEARALVPGSLSRTDELIRTARGQTRLSTYDFYYLL